MTPRLTVEEPLPFDEAWRRVEATVEVLAAEDCPLPEATGRILAHGVRAAHAVPPFVNAMVDGYAVHASETSSATPDSPVELRVVGEVAAGDSGLVEFGSGEAVRIMTGAPVPACADGIVMLEWTEWQGDRVRIHRPAVPGRYVRAVGEDLAAGDEVLSAGARLTPAALGVLASVGIARVSVHARPRVAILATGNELLDLGEALAPGKIRSSNQHVLAGAVRQAGAEAIDLGIARDDPGEMGRRIAEARGCHVLLTSGGVSVGDHDHVQEVLALAGFERIFWRVATSPGKPLLFGRLGRTLVFGLPGNPVSSLVAFENFVRPALLRQQGCPRTMRPRVRATTDGDLTGPEDRRHFARVVARLTDGGWRVREVGPHGSGNLTSLVRANALAIVPEGVRTVAAGGVVETVLLGEAGDYFGTT